MRNLPPNRIIGLDLLRAIAILLVLLSHGTYIIYDVINEFVANVFISSYGHLGVTLFFVLSGFLVGKIFLEQIAIPADYTFNNISNFWIRRWFRTLPNYYLFLMLYTVLSFFVVKEASIHSANLMIEKGTSIIEYGFFVQCLVNNGTTFFGQAWSLAVEEWFYFALPLVFFSWYFLKRSGIDIFKLLASLFLLINSVKAFIYIKYIQVQELTVLFNIDNILLGVMVAYIFIKHPVQLLKFKKECFLAGVFLLFLVHLLTIAFVLKSNPQDEYKLFINLLTGLGFAFCLPFFLELHLPKRMANAVKVISVSSYTMYLSHLLITYFFIDHFLLELFRDSSSYWRFIVFALYVAFTVLLSYLHFKYFEVPLMALREKITLGKYTRTLLARKNKSVERGRFGS